MPVELTLETVAVVGTQRIVQRSTLKMPTRFELLEAQRAGTLCRDDLLAELRDAETGELLDLVDGAAWIPGGEDLLWRCDTQGGA